MIRPFIHWLNSLLFNRAAETDADAGVDGVDRQLKRAFGKDPKSLAQGSLAHTEAVQALSDRANIRALEQQLRELLAARATIGSPTPLTIQLAFLTACEFFGVLNLLKNTGLGAEERVLPAFGLTFSLMFLTKHVFSARATRTTAPPAVASAEPANSALWKEVPALAKGALVPLVYTVLVAAIAFARIGAHDEGEDVSDTQTFADAILTIAITAGPAWLAAHVAKKRGPAVELARHLRETKSALRAARRREERARKYLASLDEASAKHTDATTRAAAAYSLAHDRAQGGGESN